MNQLERLYGKTILPMFYLMNGDLRFPYYEFYKKNLKKTREEIKEYQSERLRKLIAHAYETVPYYKELFDKNKIKPDDIKTSEDLKKIPLLDKKTIMSNPQILLSNKKYKLIKSFSGGSTGNKITIYKDKKYHEMCSGVWMRDLYSVGIEPGMKSVWVWGDEYANQPFLKKLNRNASFYMNRRLLFNVFKYTDDSIEKWIHEKFNKFKPEYIYGFAGIIYDIARCIKERNIQISQIKKIITTSERLEHRKFIEDVFKCKVIDQYGCSEVNSVAIEDDDYIMHSSDDFVILELNENNEVLLTPLESYGMPLIRYKVGDIGFKIKKGESNTSQFNQFNLSVGRIYEVLYNTKKEKIAPGMIKQVIEDENLEINEFQVVQHSYEKVELNVVKDKFTKDESVKRTAEILKEILGCSQVDIKYHDKFPTEPNGKRIAFKCLIKREEHGR